MTLKMLKTIYWYYKTSSLADPIKKLNKAANRPLAVVFSMPGRRHSDNLVLSHFLSFRILMNLFYR